MDITPVAAAGRPLIESYGPGFIKVGGVRFEGPVLISTGQATPCQAIPGEAELARLWQGQGPDDPPVELLLYGGGARLVLPPVELRQILQAHGIRIEPMDTGAACRTFNVLLLEDRLISALLVP